MRIQRQHCFFLGDVAACQRPDLGVAGVAELVVEIGLRSHEVIFVEVACRDEEMRVQAGQVLFQTGEPVESVCY